VAQSGGLQLLQGRTETTPTLQPLPQVANWTLVRLDSLKVATQYGVQSTHIHYAYSAAGRSYTMKDRRETDAGGGRRTTGRLA
jgi:hypothetical protein